MHFMGGGGVISSAILVTIFSIQTTEGIPTAFMCDRSNCITVIIHM